MAQQECTDQDLRELLVLVGMEPSVSVEAYSLSFEALELDSLARVEMASRVRDRFGVEVEAELAADSTPEELRQLVNLRLAAAQV
jgi:acyl carrier protein